MANLVPNHFKYLLATKAIDFANDVFQIIIMDSGFAFNVDDDAEYSDVSAEELANGNGYTTGGETLAGVSVTEDDVNDRCSIEWNNASWTAAGGPVGPTPGAIIFDDTVVNDPIVGFLDFGAEYTQADGGTATLSSLEVRIS